MTLEKVRYMISDAANIVDVETHVLRYWEEELELDIPRNEMGHRYYTKENIAEFQKIKELKALGYQLRTIKSIIHENTMDYQTAIQPETTGKLHMDTPTSEDKMNQFKELMSEIVGQAIALNNEELSLQIGTEVGERVLKEMNYLMREQDNLQEERYKKLDAAIRGNVRRKTALFGKRNKMEKATSKKPAHA